MKTVKKLLTKAKIAELLRTGNFMVRMDDGEGRGHNGFRWGGLGEWTTCPNWRPESYKNPPCDNGGLFGQSPKAAGYAHKGKRLALCETKGRQAVVDGNKIKVRKAMPLAYGMDIPTKLLNAIPGLSLDLRGTQITSLPEGLHVGGYLYLRGTQIKNIPAHLKKKVVR